MHMLAAPGLARVRTRDQHRAGIDTGDIVRQFVNDYARDNFAQAG